MLSIDSLALGTLEPVILRCFQAAFLGQSNANFIRVVTFSDRPQKKL